MFACVLLGRRLEKGRNFDLNRRFEAQRSPINPATIGITSPATNPATNPVTIVAGFVAGFAEG